MAKRAMRIGNSNLKSNGKKKDRSTNNRANKVSGLSLSKPKAKWEEDRNERSKAIHIQPKGINQNLFLESMRKNIITVGTGSAGTGKTYLACLYACSELLSGNIRKIVITRPYVAVSGRTTGFKPSTDIEKLRPFVKPMLEYLSDTLGKGMVEEQLELGDQIELAPLESIRGRSFDNAIIIADESSNMTIGEIQALTTRLGENTKLILIGDCAQTDTEHNGLDWFDNLARKHIIDDVGIVRFNHDDIVRSGMVRQLVIAFEREGGYRS